MIFYKIFLKYVVFYLLVESALGAAVIRLLPDYRKPINARLGGGGFAEPMVLGSYRAQARTSHSNRCPALIGPQGRKRHCRAGGVQGAAVRVSIRSDRRLQKAGDGAAGEGE